MKPATTVRDAVLLVLLTAAAVAVHGYHLGVEDQSMYLPAIKKALDPALYPHDAQFFLAQTRWTLYDEAVVGTIRATRLPVDWAMFLWHCGAVLLLLLGCLRVAQRCFAEAAAQWAGVVLVAAVLTLPVAGTLVLMADQYAHPRVLATAMALFALAAILDRRVTAFAWIVLAAAIHPQVTAFAAAHLAFQLWLPARATDALAALLLPAVMPQAPSRAWQEVMHTRRHHFAMQWTWYEWLGAYGPVLLLAWFVRIARKNGAPVLARVSARLAISCALGILAGVLITTLPMLERFVPTQPMRQLHFVYVVMLLLGGGLLGQFLLRKRVLLWLVFFIPLFGGMFVAQRMVFPSSPHVEWPGRATQNEWLEAFEWIRRNTPRDALFALDPAHMSLPGEDNHGFRALAERSMLADSVKDRGVAALFPALARDWQDQVQARADWKNFQREDFLLLRAKYGVTWIVAETPGPAGLPCPFQNVRVKVCRVE